MRVVSFRYPYPRLSWNRGHSAPQRTWLRVSCSRQFIGEEFWTGGAKDAIDNAVLVSIYTDNDGPAADVQCAWRVSEIPAGVKLTWTGSPMLDNTIVLSSQVCKVGFNAANRWHAGDQAARQEHQIRHLQSHCSLRLAVEMVYPFGRSLHPG